VAVDQAKNALGALEDKIVLGDFFAYDFGSRPFDIVYERTFLCSLPPSVWEDYVRRVAQLLSIGGKLAGIFFYGNEPEPPPYPLSDKRALELFDKQFQLIRNEAVSDSVPMFAEMERWQEWSRRDDQMLKDRTPLMAGKKPVPSPTVASSPAGPAPPPKSVATPRPAVSPASASCLWSRQLLEISWHEPRFSGRVLHQVDLLRRGQIAISHCSHGKNEFVSDRT
jgi:hypothetical protein